MSSAPLSASPDIEEARNALDEGTQEQLRESTDLNHPEPKHENQANNGTTYPEDIKKAQVEKVVVLSFRALPLQRIAELQR